MRTLLRSLRFTAAGWSPTFVRRYCSGLVILFTSCAAPYYHYHPQFELRLTRVDPPGWISTAQGNADSIIYEFHDNHVRFQWAVGSDARLDFVLDNLSPDTLRMVWEKARYVDEQLDSHRVLHAGVRISDRNKPRLDGTVKPLGKLVDFVQPEHLIVENPIQPGVVLREEPLLSLRDGNPRQVRREANSLRGRQVQILLPMVLKGATTTYRFAFQIDNVSLR